MKYFYALNLCAKVINFLHVFKQSVTDVDQKLQELRLLGHSQEDLDRIEKIANQTSVSSNLHTNGRKTSVTLLEIERNRQLLLVQQGTQVCTRDDELGAC